MLEYKGDVPYDRKPIPTRHLALGAVLFVLAWQVLLMYLWFTFPDIDTYLLRFSLSNADAIAFFALVLSFYAYWRFEKSSESDDLVYLQQFILEMKRNGVDPKDIRGLAVGIQFTQMIQNEVDRDITKDDLKKMARFMAKGILPKYIDKAKDISERVESGKVKWEDIREVLK